MEHNGEGDAGPPTSNTPLGEIRIALTEEIDKLRLEDSPRAPPTLNKQLPLEVVVHSHNMEHNGEGDAGPLTSNTPLGEIRIALTEEIDKLRLEDSPRAPTTLNKQLPLEAVVHSHKMEHNVEGDAGPSTSKSPLGEIQIALAEEIDKLRLEDSHKVPSKLNKPLIQKVSQNLRLCYSKKDCDRYLKPTSVAIGPLHSPREIDKNSRIGQGEQCKLKLAVMFIEESQGRKEDFYESVKKEINSLRNCYNFEGLETWNDEQLAWMFLVDGCALLHFIVRDVNYDWEEFSVIKNLVSIEKMDFFLLEKQLPYRLLEILIDSSAKALAPQQRAQNNPKELLEECIAEFINRSFLRLTTGQEHQIQPPSQSHRLEHLLKTGCFITRSTIVKRPAQQERQNQPDHPPHHLLDLLRRRLIDEKGGKREGINKGGVWETLIGGKIKHSPLIRNVRELKDKGIHFKAREKGSAITNNDFEDRCCMATLTLAPIFLHNTTVALLLNLSAYELCPDFKENWEITWHLSLLNCLIDNAEDAKELEDAGVLQNRLGSDEAVAKLLNKISGILVPNFKVDPDLRSDIHEYCKKSHFSGLVATVKAKLSHTCFRSPWSYLVFLGALAGLIMTGMQTYYNSPD